MSYRTSDTTIRFRDFLPREVSDGGMFSGPAFESLESAVAAANAWIAQSSVEPINLETVVIPYVPGSSTGAGLIKVSISPHNSFFQFVRLWYRPRL